MEMLPGELCSDGNLKLPDAKPSTTTVPSGRPTRTASWKKSPETGSNTRRTTVGEVLDLDEVLGSVVHSAGSMLTPHVGGYDPSGHIFEVVREDAAQVKLCRCVDLVQPYHVIAAVVGDGDGDPGGSQLIPSARTN
jgi:hypothetical protein